MNENYIISELKQGNQNLFRQIIEENSSLVLIACYKFIGCREDAEDLMQETFIEFYNSIHKFKFECKISTWLYRIAINKSIDLIRRKNRKKRLAVLVSLFGFEMEEELHPSDSNNNPAKISERNEDIKILYKFLNKFSENQKVAFVLSQINGMSYSEISEIMNLTKSSVESLIFRARKKIKKDLRDFYEKENSNASNYGFYRLIKEKS